MGEKQLITVPVQQPPVIRVQRAGKVRGKIEGLEPLPHGEEGFYYVALLLLKTPKGDRPAREGKGHSSTKEDAPSARFWG